MTDSHDNNREMARRTVEVFGNTTEAPSTLKEDVERCNDPVRVAAQLRHTVEVFGPASQRDALTPAR